LQQGDQHRYQTFHIGDGEEGILPGSY
jgi:hypothetical protein